MREVGWDNYNDGTLLLHGNLGGLLIIMFYFMFFSLDIFNRVLEHGVNISLVRRFGESGEGLHELNMEVWRQRLFVFAGRGGRHGSFSGAIITYKKLTLG